MSPLKWHLVLGWNRMSAFLDSILKEMSNFFWHIFHWIWLLRKKKKKVSIPDANLNIAQNQAWTEVLHEQQKWLTTLLYLFSNLLPFSRLLPFSNPYFNPPVSYIRIIKMLDPKTVLHLDSIQSSPDFNVQIPLSIIDHKQNCVKSTS